MSSLIESIFPVERKSLLSPLPSSLDSFMMVLTMLDSGSGWFAIMLMIFPVLFLEKGGDLSGMYFRGA